MRADIFLTQKGFFSSRSKAAEAIKNGRVQLCGKTLKPSDEIGENDKIDIIKSEDVFVSKGGNKLEKAFKVFNIDVSNKICADIGASTGGFTDCLLKHGASKVYAVDVGENQLDISLKNNGKVVIMDNTNARNLQKSSFPEQIEFISCDISFISLKYVLGAFSGILNKGGMLAALIKPQFEAGRENIGKNGIVKDKKVHQSVIKTIVEFAKTFGFELIKIINTDALPEKNTEYIALFNKI